MAHKAQLEFIERVRSYLPADFHSRRVLEVGSLDINGSIRSFFKNCEYIGIDVAPGPGVDAVCQGQDYAEPDGSFDVTISVEAMEHNPQWKETFQNMNRLTSPDGLVLMTCANLGRPEHGTKRATPKDSPLTLSIGWNYYRNLCAQDFEHALPLRDWFRAYAFYSHHYTHDLYFVGLKGGDSNRVGAARSAIRSLRLLYTFRNFRQWRSLKTMTLLHIRGEEPFRSPIQ
jgi:SAM-dependent methyltransferase